MSQMEAVVFQNYRKQNLVGVLYHGQGEKPRPCLIVCHGFIGTTIGDSRRLLEFTQYAIKQNLSVFCFDYASSGNNDRNIVDLTIDSELDDLQAAIDVVSKIDGIDAKRLEIFGHF